MRDKIAKAIFIATYPKGHMAWDLKSNYGKKLWFKKADAVLGAIRNPTERMLESGLASGSWEGGCYERPAINCWWAMVDEVIDGG